MKDVQAKHKNSRLLRLWVAIGVLILSTIVSGCFENYGRLKRDPEVTRAFKTNQVEPDYKYYYYGRSNMPYVIVGIDRTYHMRSRVWREVDHHTEQFEKMIYWIWDDIFYPPYYGFGAHILDPKGNNIGIWYSGIWWAAIRFDADNRIVIMPDLTAIVGGPVP